MSGLSELPHTQETLLQPQPETHVKFYVEEHPEQHLIMPRAAVLEQVLNPQTCEFLEERGWGVSIATVDLTADTAKIIRDVNKRNPGLPITPWIVLPDAEGYWTNRFNVPETIRRSEAVIQWVDRFNLQVDTLGFDLETPFAAARAMGTEGLMGLTKEIIRMKKMRDEQKRVGYDPEAEMEEYIDNLRKQRINTEGYEFPTFLNTKWLGILQAQNFDSRFTLIYTSVFPPALQEMLFKRGMREGTYPALGNVSSTGRNAGRIFGPHPDPLHGKEELQRDIHLAAQKAREPGFSLDQMRVFALTDIQVAAWTAEALQQLGQDV